MAQEFAIMAAIAEKKVSLPTNFHRTAFEQFLASRQEADWIKNARRAAFEIFEEKYAQELDPEEWKRVDIRTFQPGKFSVAAASGQATATSGFETLLQKSSEFAGAVEYLDGECVASRLSDDLKAKGVLFGNLSDLLDQHRAILEPLFMQKCVRPDQDRFSAWHAAFWTGGTILYVPRNVVIDAPLYSLIALAREGAADLSHTLIVLEDGASATLLEETCSADPNRPGLHIGAVELLVGSGAHLRYVQLQNWNQNTWHFAHQSGRVGRDGFLQWTVGGIGAKTAHINQHVHLDGKGSTAEVNGVTFAINKQLLSYYTQQTHHAENTRSDLLYKDVLRDRARVIWRGMIKVDPAGQKTDGYQRNDALLLSEQSRMDAIPGLEIEADDVRCTHGATAGRVDQEQVFYCMSRGMTEYEAMHMIVEGFFHGVYDRIPVEAVRETLSRAVEKKLGIGR